MPPTVAYYYDEEIGAWGEGEKSVGAWGIFAPELSPDGGECGGRRQGGLRRTFCLTPACCPPCVPVELVLCAGWERGRRRG